jgi:hypothetical protein
MFCISYYPREVLADKIYCTRENKVVCLLQHFHNLNSIDWLVFLNQYGWTWTSLRQRLYRTTLAQCKTGKNLSENGLYRGLKTYFEFYNKKHSLAEFRLYLFFKCL